MRLPWFSGRIELWGLITGSASKGRDYAIVTPVRRIRETIDAAEAAGSRGTSGWPLAGAHRGDHRLQAVLDAYIQRLLARQLVTAERGAARASEALFPK